jgi:hypothetical protein
MCGASTMTPATFSWKREACSSAIDPPSLWPNSQGFSASIPECAEATREARHAPADA